MTKLEEFIENKAGCWKPDEKAAADCGISAFVREVRERAERENKFKVTELELIGAAFLQTAKELLEE